MSGRADAPQKFSRSAATIPKNSKKGQAIVETAKKERMPKVLTCVNLTNRRPVIHCVDEILIEWVKRNEQRKIALQGPMIKAKALEIFKAG